MLLLQEWRSRAFDQLVESLLRGSRRGQTAEENTHKRERTGIVTKYKNDFGPGGCLCGGYVKCPLLGSWENIWEPTGLTTE